jgi:hypothetical protein
VETLPNQAFLERAGVAGQGAEREVFGVDLGDLMDSRRAQEWNQQYQAMAREQDMRAAAGIGGIQGERDYDSRVQRMGGDVRLELEKYHLSRAERRATDIARKHETMGRAVGPAVVAAGIYIGRPMRARINDDSWMSLRTNLRDQYGSLEYESPLGRGQFEFRPRGSQRVYASPGSVNFQDAMDMNRITDFSQERYQFSFSRKLPLGGLSSQVLYGAGSKTVAGALSKQITENLTCVVDSVHWLTPYESTGTDEQKVRLRYDIHF